MKKRLLSLAAVLVAVCLVFTGCGQGGSGNNSSNSATENAVKEVLAKMTTRQKITQMMMLRFKTWGTGDAQEPVRQLNESQAELLKTEQFGGVIVFTENMQTAGNGAAFIENMRRANQAGNALADLLIGVDQEGGYVTRLATGTQGPGSMAIGASADTEVAKAFGALTGSELKAVGIDLDFAPSVDVNNEPANPVIGIRSFSDDAATVASMGRAFIAGLHSQGIMTAVKHFPGHGNTATDSHTGLPLVLSSLSQLEQLELVPFAEAIKGGTDVIMSAHIQFPQIEGAKYASKADGKEIYLPATLSKTILTDLLRNKMGFNGVIITDSMVMDAIAANFDATDAARLAILAGADMLLIPQETRNPDEIRSLKAEIDALTALVDKGEIPMARIDEAVTRILTLKANYNRLQLPELRDLAKVRADAAAVVGCKANHDEEWRITEKTVTLVKNEEFLPLTSGGKIVIVCPYTSEQTAINYGINKLKADGKMPASTEVSILCYNGMTSEAAKIAALADKFIAVSTVYDTNDLDPAKTDWTNFLDKLISAVHSRGGKIAVISAQLPYDLARFTDADALMAVYNARGMSKDPGDFSGDVPQYAPNLPVAVYMALGGGSPTGKLPVNVPKLNADYSYSRDILFPRGTSLTW